MEPSRPRARLALGLLYDLGVTMRRFIDNPLPLVAVSAAAFGAVFALSSCLYWAGINHAPDAEIILQEGATGLAVDGFVELSARGSDPDDDRVSYRWYAEVTDEQGDRYAVLDATGELGAIHQSRPVSTAQTFNLLITSRGSYKVELVVSDTLGAEAIHARTFEVGNRAPVLELSRFRLDDGDADATTGDDDVPGLGRFLLSAAKSSDPDDDLGCNASHTIEFKLLKPVTNPFSVWTVVKCDAAANEVLDKLEFGGATVTEKTEVEIEVTLRDTHEGVSTQVHKLTLLPNKPPCIMETSPSLTQEQVWVPFDLEGTDGLTFQIIRLLDDVHQTEYRWQLSRSPDGPFVDSLVQSGFQLELDAWSAGAVLGETIYLRVVAFDQDKTTPDCDVGQQLCKEDDALADACYRWVTWEVLFQ